MRICAKVMPDAPCPGALKADFHNIAWSGAGVVRPPVRCPVCLPNCHALSVALCGRSLMLV